MNQEQQWPARTVSRWSTSSNVHHWLSQLPAYFFAINFPNAISFDIPDGSVFILQGQCVFYASLNGWTLSFRSVPAWPAFCAKSKPTMVKWRPDWTAALFFGTRKAEVLNSLIINTTAKASCIVCFGRSIYYKPCSCCWITSLQKKTSLANCGGTLASSGYTTIILILTHSCTSVVPNLHELLTR